MNTKVIKQKMKSVGSIKKITRTMEMVSVAKMKKASDKAFAMKDFNSIAFEILRATASDKSIKHSLLEERSEGETITILFAGNKGLCGGYNSQLFRSLNKTFEKGDKIIAVGKYAEKIAKRLNGDLLLSFPKNSLTESEVRTIVSKIVEDFLAKDSNIKNVKLVNAELINAASYKVNTSIILPFRIYSEGADSVKLNLNNKDNGREMYTYEPGEVEVISQIVPLLIAGVLASASRNAEAAEHAARMIAMKTATDNAGELLNELKLSYNTARQSKITQEIAEISSGAMALG